MWIPITILAAFSQNLRSTFQKKLQSNLSDIGSTYVRFLYGLPFAIIYLIVLNNKFGTSNILYSSKFFLFCSLGGISQIIATFLLLKIFNSKNFAVGTAYSKTEPMQAVFFGLIILNESINLIGLSGIVMGLFGVILMTIKSFNKTFSILTFFNTSTYLGILSGTFFGISAVLFRGASLSLNNSNFLLSSALTLAIVLFIQTLLLTIYLFYFDKKQILLTFNNFKDCIIVGFFGALASICWFYAMTIQNVAYVRALGQIELIFTIFITIFYFREKITINEIFGIILVILGIITIIMFS
tara:strand:+ start:848 stop:1741 length:894 start_codon:yes stop_codon:yes gene_type:complete